MKILFLDIDGVLNNTPYLQKRSYEEIVSGVNNKVPPIDMFNMEQLNRVLKKTGCKIIVSSTWRGMGLEGVRKELEGAGVPENTIVGVTPSIDGSLSNRGEEIAMWIEEQHFIDSSCKDKIDVKRYAIVDDYNDMLEHQQPFFVFTTMEEGLTPSKADELIKILNPMQT